MYVNHRAWVASDERSTNLPDPTGPVFMFGTFDAADETSSASIGTLGESILGLRENADLMEVATWRHRHAEVAADASSSAFMFGVHAEQPSPAPPDELPLYLRAAALD